MFNSLQKWHRFHPTGRLCSIPKIQHYIMQGAWNKHSKSTRPWLCVVAFWQGRPAPVGKAISCKRHLCDMLYGTVVLFCLITLEQWRSIGSTSSKYKHQAKAYGVDLRSLHFPSEYHATGVLSLPTSNISEPFEVWHSKTHDKSRIDYYHGKIIHMFRFFKLTSNRSFNL